MEWTHDDLLHDLASHIKSTGYNGSRMVWTDISMGSGSSQRPDVFSLEKSFARPNPTAYEIKVSRGDFLSDVKSGKWTGYLQFASKVVFCLPEGLVKKTEIPTEAGLMVRGEKGWRSIKKATVSGRIPDFNHMMRLLLECHDKYWQQQRFKVGTAYSAQKQIKKKHGEGLAKIIADVERAQWNIDQAELQAERIIKRANNIRESAEQSAKEQKEMFMASCEKELSEIREALGLPPDAGRMDILYGARRIVNAIHGQESKQVSSLKRFLYQSEQIGKELKTLIEKIESVEAVN